MEKKENCDITAFGEEQSIGKYDMKDAILRWEFKSKQKAHLIYKIDFYNPYACIFPFNFTFLCLE